MDIFFTYMDKGGIIFTLLFFLSIITVAIVIYKYFEIFIMKKLNFSKLSSYIDSDQIKFTLIEIKENYIETMPFAKKEIVGNIIDLIKSDQPKNVVEQKIEILISKEFKKIYSLLPSLEIISQVSPLIGLLGTVIGMIDSFNELELGGSLVDPSILAGGIWTALLTTAMGLIVAIPALVCHYFLDKKINALHESFQDIVVRLFAFK